MIVDTGALALLGGQASYLATLEWGLFTSNTTITNSTVWGALTEAAWTGYSRATMGTMSAPSLVSGRALSSPVTTPQFSNSSGADVTIYGWFLVDPSGTTTLVAAANIGAVIIPDGQSYVLLPGVTDKEE